MMIPSQIHNYTQLREINNMDIHIHTHTHLYTHIHNTCIHILLDTNYE